MRRAASPLPSPARTRLRRTGLLATVALTALVSACSSGGGSSSTADEPGNTAQAVEPAAPADAGAGNTDPLADLSDEEICARIPLAALDGLSVNKVSRVEGYGTAAGTTCEFRAAASYSEAMAVISDLEHLPIEDLTPRSGTKEPLPELGAGALLMAIPKGFLVMAEHPHGRILSASLHGDPAGRSPSKEATIAWYRAVAARI